MAGKEPLAQHHLRVEVACHRGAAQPRQRQVRRTGQLVAQSGGTELFQFDRRGDAKGQGIPTKDFG